jgi:hypothetical protein
VLGFQPLECSELQYVGLLQQRPASSCPQTQASLGGRAAFVSELWREDELHQHGCETTTREDGSTPWTPLAKIRSEPDVSSQRVPGQTMSVRGCPVGDEHVHGYTDRNSQVL